MRVFGEGMVYQDWVDDLEYYIMSMGLNDEVLKDDKRRLGLFITCGGPRVKEVCNTLNKNTPKAKDSANKDVSEYQHARNVVDAKMKINKNQTYNETFQYRNLAQRSGESFASFIHRCEVGISSCGFSVEDMSWNYQLSN